MYGSFCYRISRIIVTRHLGDESELLLPLANLKHSDVYADSYAQPGISAPGEFNDALRKSFDISSLPIGSTFTVNASVNGGDGTNGNVRVRVHYNGVSYESRTFGLYHISATSSATLKKASGQNSVNIYTGGSKNHNAWATIGQSN